MAITIDMLSGSGGSGSGSGGGGFGLESGGRDEGEGQVQNNDSIPIQTDYHSATAGGGGWLDGGGDNDEPYIVFGYGSLIFRVRPSANDNESPKLTH